MFSRSKFHTNTNEGKRISLVHAADELVDVVLAVTRVTALVVAGLLLAPAAVGGVELEGPEERVGLLEVLAASEDLVNEVFHTDNALAAERLQTRRYITTRE